MTSVNLADHLGKRVVVTMRDGRTKRCTIEKGCVSDLTFGTRVSPWLTDGIHFADGRNCGCEGGTDWDIVSIELDAAAPITDAQQSQHLKSDISKATKTRRTKT